MNEIIGNNIMTLRKENGLTQEQLANALGISYQAVSKWETGNACPDISTLPLLADLFSVSVDQLIGRVPLTTPPEDPEEAGEGDQPIYTSASMPWPDDDTFYAVLYHGHELIGDLAGDPELEAAAKHFVFQYEGPAQNVDSLFSVQIDGDVSGNVQAGADLSCGDVGRDAISGASLNCSDVGGDVRSNGSVNCGDVAGSVSAGGNVDCGDVSRDVRCGGNLSCGDVNGNASAGGSATCGDVAGNVCAGTRVECGSVDGTVIAGGSFTGNRKHTIMKDEQDDLDLELDDVIEKTLDEELDDMIDKTVENSIKFGMNMSDFGVNLGKRISDAVQKAYNFSGLFRGGNHQKQEEADE